MLRHGSKISLRGLRGNQGKEARRGAQDTGQQKQCWKEPRTPKRGPRSRPGASRPVWSHVDCGSPFQTNSPSGEAGGWALLSGSVCNGQAKDTIIVTTTMTTEEDDYCGNLQIRKPRHRTKINLFRQDGQQVAEPGFESGWSSSRIHALKYSARSPGSCAGESGCCTNPCSPKCLLTSLKVP